tara:strand:+ start:8320 stop:9276 length:957 start_codon:yes stop_codon:yes gene_type:complete
MPKSNEWGITQVWNEQIKGQQRPMEKRERIYASEIGKSFYERYQKMNAVPFDTPYNDRTLRKFSAGIWFEDMIGYVLNKIGIVQSMQEYVDIPETKQHLRITGKIDFLAGGIVDWNVARERVKAAEFPEFVQGIAMKLIDDFESKYPKGLDDRIIEVKSVNSQVFWAKKHYLQEAYPHHTMQAYTYARHLKKMATILYISKDDLTTAEFLVHPKSKVLEEKWLADVTQMSEYIRSGQEPDKPEGVVFDKRKKLRFQHKNVKHIITGCWTENWEVAWSPYFKLITGFDKVDEDSYMDQVRPVLKEKNEEIKDKYKANLT